MILSEQDVVRTVRLIHSTLAALHEVFRLPLPDFESMDTQWRGRMTAWVRWMAEMDFMPGPEAAYRKLQDLGQLYPALGGDDYAMPPTQIDWDSLEIINSTRVTMLVRTMQAVWIDCRDVGDELAEKYGLVKGNSFQKDEHPLADIDPRQMSLDDN